MSINCNDTKHIYRFCESYDCCSFSKQVDSIIDGLCPLDYDLNFSICSTPSGILYSAFIIIHFDAYKE